MRALVFTAPMEVELREVAEADPANGDVVVSVIRAGICGSELQGVREPGFRRPPLIMGHEFAGVTRDGTRVVVNPLLSCGQCEVCKSGSPQICKERQLIGVHRAGGFAERVAVPASAIHMLPSGMSWDAAALVEPVANAVHASNLGEASSGMRVGVIGAGAIGLVCLQMALERQASGVFVAEVSPHRRAVALRLGAVACAEELVGEFDLVFDAVGSRTSHESAVRCLRPGGTSVWLGLSSNEGGFDARELVRMEKRIVGSFAYTAEEFREAIDLAARWNSEWVETVPLEEAAEVFHRLMDGSMTPVKALIVPNDAAAWP